MFGVCSVFGLLCGVLLVGVVLFFCSFCLCVFVFVCVFRVCVVFCGAVKEPVCVSIVRVLRLCVCLLVCVLLLLFRNILFVSACLLCGCCL